MTSHSDAPKAADPNLTFLEAVLDEIGAYIFTKDLNGCYTFVNQAVSELFGVERKHIIGLDDSHFFDLALSNELRQNDLQVLQEGKVIEREERNIIKATGETRIYWTVKKPLRDDSGNIFGMCGISTDFTELHQLRQELEHQATTDMLTGLKNRRYFWEHATVELRRSRRQHFELSFALLDIDYFKSINDSFGHPAGDEVLRRVAQHCLAHTREEDILARIGGEEFCLLLPNTGCNEARILAERIRKAIVDLKIEGDWEGKISVSLSIGIASLLPTDESLDDLYKRADRAIYHAKAQGRNRTVLSE